MMINVIAITTPEELAEAHKIRRKVFVEEQACPPELEYEFEEESHHFLAYVDGSPAGTARWRATTNGYKLERFAVLKEMRGKKIGEALLSAVVKSVTDHRSSTTTTTDDGSESTGKMIYLHAQLTARDFYLKYVFEPVGEHFWEAGIEHVKMKLNH